MCFRLAGCASLGLAQFGLHPLEQSGRHDRFTIIEQGWRGIDFIFIALHPLVSHVSKQVTDSLTVDGGCGRTFGLVRLVYVRDPLKAFIG